MSSEELPPLSEIGMMYASGHDLALLLLFPAPEPVPLPRNVATAWNASTKELAAVPPEKTQMPLAPGGGFAAGLTAGSEPGVQAAACSAMAEENAVGAAMAAIKAGGREGVPVPSSISRLPMCVSVDVW